MKHSYRSKTRRNCRFGFIAWRPDAQNGLPETFLEDPVCYNDVGAMLGFTGTFKGKRISVQGTGMSIPSALIYCHELINFMRLNLIRWLSDLQNELPGHCHCDGRFTRRLWVNTIPIHQCRLFPTSRISTCSWRLANCAWVHKILSRRVASSLQMNFCERLRFLQTMNRVRNCYYWNGSNRTVHHCGRNTNAKT